MAQVKKKPKTFPLTLEITFSGEIDILVFHTKTESKHQYIIDAIKDKIKKDRRKLKKEGAI